MNSTPQFQVTNGPFRLDVNTVCTRNNGTTVECGGTVSNGVTLRAVYVKTANPDDANPHNHPYQSGDSPTVRVANQAGTWCVQGIPLNGRTSFRFFIWGLIDQGTFERPGSEAAPFTLGSGSGSIGSCGSGTPPCGGNAESGPQFLASATSQGLPGAIPDVLPQVYKMILDMNSLRLDAYGAGYLSAGLLASASLYLTFDEHVSTPTAFVWSGRNLADATGRWALRVQCDDYYPRAMLSFQQSGQSKMSKPLVWATKRWAFHSSNKLICERCHTNPLAFPTIRVEPA